MTTRITLPMIKLLHDVAKKHHIDIDAFTSPDGSLFFNEKNREALLEALADEMCETGLLNNDEPNERGIRLDELIGIVNMGRIDPYE